jgi:thiazole synthase/sulfur carrier protein
MLLTVNGELREAEDGLDLKRFLARLGLEPEKVAVERNLGIVPRSRFATTILAAGDKLEIVHFVGGG